MSIINGAVMVKGGEHTAEIGNMIRYMMQLFPNGIRVRDITRFTSFSRKEVKNYLYEHEDEFEKNGSFIPLWKMKSISPITDTLMAKLQNREDALSFSQEDFDELADWEYGTAFVGEYKYETQKGNIIECDSKSEIMLLAYLEENGLVNDIGGQMLEISYESAFRAGLSYFPDIVALTRDNHIAVFEVKAATAMDNHSNMEKYRALAEYCKERGYMYVMIDPAADFISFEEIRDMDVCSELLEMFVEWQEKPDSPRRPYKSFDNDDVNDWYERFGDGYTKKEFYLQVHSLIMYYEWFNVYKHGFKAYSRPVMLSRSHKVIDYL